MNINNNLSSIYAHQELLNNSSHNIANSNTENFDRTDSKIIQDKNDNIEISSTPVQESTNLVKDMTDQIVSYHAVGVNSVALKTKNEIEGTLLDIKA